VGDRVFETHSNNTYRLYHYWRSSASWRVRWALAIKGIVPEYVAINLLSDEAESPAHRARNPLGYVPVLERLDVKEDALGRYLTESTAILEWLEETHPEPRLLPAKSEQRAYVRALAQLINASLQPLQNPPVTERHSPDKNEQKKWVQDWNHAHLSSFTKLAQKTAGKFCFGDQLTMADLFLIPQIYGARRFEVPVESDFPLLSRIFNAAMETPECQRSSPEAFQPTP
jgi:maleylacetoacetate isomerase